MDNEDVVLVTNKEQQVVAVPVTTSVITKQTDVDVLAVERDGVVFAEADNVIVVTVGAVGERGPAGPAGDGTINVMAAIALGGHRFVVADSNGQAIYADSTNATHSGFVLGMTIGAVNAGDTATVLRQGELTEPTWNWAANTPIYLGANGTLTQTIPVGPSAKFSQIVAFPITPTKIFVNMREPITIV